MAFLPRRKIYFIFIFILALIIVFNYLGWLNWLKYRSRLIFMPILTNANEMGVRLGDNYHFFINKEDFFSQFNKCLADAQQKETALAQNQLLVEENAELKKQLGFVRRTSFTTMTASVVGRNVDSIEKTIIINTGEMEKIKVGHPVVAGNGALIGRVTKVEREISVVRLINDNQSKILATVLNKERSLGVVEAGYGSSVRMNFIPRNEVVLIGEQIITSGQDLQVPKGLLIGKVISIENEAYQPFQQAVLETTVNLEKIIAATVILSF